MRHLIYSGCIVVAVGAAAAFAMDTWTVSAHHGEAYRKLGEKMDALHQQLDAILNQLDGRIEQNQTINMSEIDRQELAHEALKLRAEERRNGEAQRNVQRPTVLHD